MSRVESAIRVVLAFNKAVNCHDIVSMMKLMSDDCRFESYQPSPDGAIYPNKEAIAQYWQTFFSESPEAHIAIEEIFGLGFRCVMHWRYEWVDADGKANHLRGVDIFQVKDDLICENLSYVKGATAVAKCEKT